MEDYPDNTKLFSNDKTSLPYGIIGFFKENDELRDDIWKFIERGSFRVSTLKYIIDNLLDHYKEPYSIYWNFKDTWESTKTSHFKFKGAKELDTISMECDKNKYQDISQLVLYKTKTKYILRLDSHISKDEMECKNYLLSESDILEFLKTFQNKEIYNINYIFLP